MIIWEKKLLVRRYKIPMYDVRKVARIKKLYNIPDDQPIPEKYASEFLTSYMPINKPEQHIPVEEQEYDIVWLRGKE